MFIPKGVDENNRSLHHEIVEHDVAWQDMRERLSVMEEDLGKRSDKWNLVFCMTQEQLEERKREEIWRAQKHRRKPEDWVPIIFEASTADDVSASGS
jgi:hypothetical protein